MLGGKAKHWWRMEKRLLGTDEPLAWDQFQEVFFKKYFPRSVCRQKESEFIQLRHGSMKIAEYGTKFTKLSRFAFELISSEESKAFHFQEDLSLFLKDKLFLHKFETYSEVVESYLLAERSARELQKYSDMTRPGYPPRIFPGWSRLVKSHCTIPREDTVELHFKEGSKHMH